MTKPVRIPVKPEIWQWALKESQKGKAEFLSRFPQAEKWLKQELSPTFRQLEDAAKFLHVPFGYMMLNTPPEENVMNVEFRSISNKIPGMSKNLQDTILKMDSKRSWMSDYRKDLGWDKLEVIKEFKKERTGDIIFDAQLAKKLLGLDDDWYNKVRDLDDGFWFLKEKLEEIGILVMRSGIVGGNTHRSLDIKEFRAFMLYDNVAPLIFINNNDSKAGKTFSLIHEYFHVLFEEEDIFFEAYAEDAQIERQINFLTAEFLMPQKKMLALWNTHDDICIQIDRLSKSFKVSKLALAITLNNLGLINRKIVDKVKTESIEYFEEKTEKGGGGDYYRTYHSRMSTVFTETVIRSAESGEIGYTDAFRLLGVRGKTYDNIKAEVMPYG